MMYVSIVFVIVLVSFALHRLSLRRIRNSRSPLWANIRAIRKARESGWSGVNAEIDRLQFEKYEERAARRARFAAAVRAADAAGEDSGRGDGAGRSAPP